MHGLEQRDRRILIVDDNRAIHEDFRKILGSDKSDADLADMEANLFGEATSAALELTYHIDDAYQGQEAVKKVVESQEAGQRYDLAFVDVRMPPGWDGAETIARIWQEDADLQIVICTAYSDYSWSDLFERLGGNDKLLILKKPFDNVEVQQLAATLTEKRHLADKAKLRMEELEQLVEQRTAALREKDEQLRQSQKMEAVGCLAGGIAHEFNNLLQAIAGFTSCAMEGLDREDQRYQDLQQVRKAADRAATLTRQLLGFSRRQILDRKNVDANALVADLGKMIRPVIGERIDLDLRLGENVGVVHADAAELQQAVLNLCINARDAMPAGGKLLVKTEDTVLSEALTGSALQVGPGRCAVISVVDTGCGMAPEVKERIFEPFFTTKEVGQGTGLGLATVYGIVQQHEGAVCVRSEPGQGTTFEIYLPTVDETSETNEAEPAVAGPGGTETILVAEDEPIVRNLTVRILEDAGYTVLTAHDGEEALRIFEEHGSDISLSVLDAVMPKISGPDVYLQIKEACPEAHVIFCSGYDPDTAKSDFIGQHSQCLIQKPFEPHVLLRTIREVLDNAAEPPNVAHELPSATVAALPATPYGYVPTF